MQDYSTLIYFVTNFQNDVETCKLDLGEYSFEDKLTKMDFEPSERSVKNILDFARSYDALETVSAGYVEMNFN